MSVTAPTPRPCATCPYRRDVPSGVWDPEEYDKLPLYDLPTWAQPTRMFDCHQRNGHLCTGWVAVHDMHESLALRLAVADGRVSGELLAELVDFTPHDPAAFHPSGAAAREHGIRDVAEPGARARSAIDKLVRARNGGVMDS